MSDYENRVHDILERYRKFNIISTAVFSIAIIICLSAIIAISVLSPDKSLSIMFLVEIITIGILWDTTCRWIKEKSNALILAEIVKELKKSLVNVPVEVKNENN